MSYSASLHIRQANPNLTHTTTPTKTGSLGGRKVEQVKPESKGIFGKIANAVGKAALSALKNFADELLKPSYDHKAAVNSYAFTGYFPTE
jgi:hypothetical protein